MKTLKKFLFASCFLLATQAHAQRWILYSATAAINCSSYANGGKLTTSGADVVCADDSTGDASTFLTTSSATATYLTKSSATATYLQQTSSTSFLTTSSATATYLTKSSAAATYFQPAGATTSNVPEGSNLYYTTARSTSAVSASAPLTYGNGVFGVDSSSVTLYGPSIPASKIASGSLGSGVITSSLAVNSVTPSAVSANTYSNITLPAANVAAGSLGSSVLASSIAVNAVQDASIVGVGGAKITGTGSIPNAAIDGSSVTKYGASIPASAISSGSLGASVIASSIAVNAVQDASIVGVGGAKITGTGTIPNAAVDGSSVTKYGPNIPASAVSAGSLGISVIASSIAASGVTSGTYGSATQVSSVTISGDGRVTGAAGVTISLTNSNLQSGTYSNVTVPAANVAAGSLGGSVIASSFTPTGTWTSVTATTGTITNLVPGGLTSNRVPYYNGTKIVDSSNLTFDGTTLAAGAQTVTSLTDSGLTSGRIPYSTTGGLLTDSSAMTFATASGISILGTAQGPMFSWGRSGQTPVGYLYADNSSIGIGSFSSSPVFIFTGYGAGFVFFSTDSKIGLGINYTASNISAVVDINGSVRMRSFGSGAATFDANGNVSSVSDERLKNIDGFYTPGLPNLLNINPILYHWNDKSGMETQHQYAGFSAQNVQKFIPLGVGENNQGYLSLQDRAVMATMVNAIKELSARVTELENQIKQKK